MLRGDLRHDVMNLALENVLADDLVAWDGRYQRHRWLRRVINGQLRPFGLFSLSWLPMACLCAVFTLDKALCSTQGLVARAMT